MTNAELAILSLVVEQPRHGYEIEQIIQERGMREWTEVGFSSIYYVLKKLERAGMIASRLEEAGRGPARKVYHATPAGRRALHAGVLDALAVPQRSYPPLQLGLAGLPGLSQGEASAALHSHHDALAARLAHVEGNWEGKGPLPYFVDAMFDYSVTMIRAEMAWIEQLLHSAENQGRGDLERAVRPNHREPGPMAAFTVRSYSPSDRPGVRAIYGNDEFARPALLRKYPRMADYLADELSYFTDYEPASLFVAEAQGQIVGALLGAVDTTRCAQVYRDRIRPMLRRRCLSGAYGWPGWLPAIVRTERAERHVQVPNVDRARYPAHLHIGVLPAWRRMGIATALIAEFNRYLTGRRVPGWHLYVSSYHPLGLAFYRKLGLELLGQFDWRLHDGRQWLTVTEQILGLRLDKGDGE